MSTMSSGSVTESRTVSASSGSSGVSETYAANSRATASISARMRDQFWGALVSSGRTRTAKWGATESKDSMVTRLCPSINALTVPSVRRENWTTLASVPTRSMSSASGSSTEASFCADRIRGVPVT